MTSKARGTSRRGARVSDIEHDYESLLWSESADLASLIDEIDDAEFDRASLCDGWRVRDVVSHMVLGHVTPMPTMVALVARSGFNVPRASRRGSARYGSTHSAAELREKWHEVVDGRVTKGISRRISTKEMFVDHLIHHQDIRRPLDRRRSISAERLTAALDAMPTIGGFVKSKQRMRGLTWTASDVEWTFGSGPEVTGPGEALILLASGRRAPIDEAAGDGVSTLDQRLAA
jgi:uncharacterized protein (TIGR03083 family)